MKVRQVTLTVGHLDQAASFYRDVLQLPVVAQGRQVMVTIGSSRLVLKPGEPFRGAHHVAFGIAPADFALTRSWLKGRVELVVADGSEVIEGPDGWNSRSLYFLGPEQILLEFIARDADAEVPASEGAVSRALSISEVGIGVSDVAEAVPTLTRELDLPPFPPQGPHFAPVGGHEGLLILVHAERIWFPSHHQPAARGPVVLEIDAPRAARLSLTPNASLVASWRSSTGRDGRRWPVRLTTACVRPGWQPAPVRVGRWAGVPDGVRRAVLVASAVFVYGTVVHVVQFVVGGGDPYPSVPRWLAVYFVSLTVLDPLAAVLLLLRRRAGLLLGCAVLVTDAAANGYANYVIDASAGVTAGRVGHAVITLLALALLLVTPRLWPWLRPVALHR